MKTLLFAYVFFIMSVSVFAQNSKQNFHKNQDYGIVYIANDSLQYETYPHDGGFGYRLYIRYKLLVNQPTIPAIAGNNPFKNEADARKIVKLACLKLAKSHELPTIEIKEIKKILKI